MAGELSFLEKDGVEIANAARIAGYLARGLQPRIELVRGPQCSVLGSEMGAGGVSPAADPAPWYSSAVPESGSFLGLLITDLKVQVKEARPSGARLGGIGGSFVGPPEADGALMLVEGMLVAQNGRGLAYGREWLTSVLGAGPCDPCALSELRYREACPPVGDATVGEWILYDAGVTGDGITRGDADPDASAWEDVSFQLTSQHAARFRAAVVAQAAAPIAPVESIDLDVIDFATNPFTAGALLVPAGATSGHVYGSGHVSSPAGVASRFYRAGPAQSDVTITCSYHTGSSLASETLALAARWEAPTSATADLLLVGSIKPHAGQSYLEVAEYSRVGGTMTGPSPTGVLTESPLTTLSPTTTYFLRFAVSGDFARLQVFDVQPYDSGGNLLDIAPVAETAWPPAAPVSGFTPRGMSSHAAAAAGTWGVALWTTSSATAPWLDDLTQRSECIDFVRWFCETPPVAVEGVQLEPTRPSGTVGARVTLDATAGQIANAYIEAFRGSCPVVAGALPFARIDVPLLAAGGRLVIDSARRRVVYTDPAGAVYDGTALLALAAGRDVEWLEASQCDAPICLRAGLTSWCGTHPDATITIERQERAR